MEIGGRYKLIRRLGSGGTGIVYCAADTVLGRQVAVKALKPGLDVRILRQEAQALARLALPQVVGLHDIVTQGAQTFLILEFVDGCSLERWLHDFGPLDVDTALSVLSPVAAAVHAAHMEGLLHCDLKPANVLLSRRGEIKLTDFTLARTRDNGAFDGTAGASAAYAAPEQLSGGTVDERTDVFGLGMLLAAMVHPLDGSDEMGRRVQDVIARAMAPQPEDRFPSVEAMMLTLPSEDGEATKIFGLPVASELTRVAVRRPERAARSRRRLPALAALPAAALLAVLAVLWHLTASAAPQRSAVPRLVMLPAGAAVQVTRSLSFHAVLSRAYSSVVPAGEILGQEPPAGSHLVRGATVRLTVSLGPRPIPVPDVEGLSKGEAIAQLGALGFQVRLGTEETVFHTPGDVRDQSVAPGALKTPGSTITITVSVRPWWWPFS